MPRSGATRGPGEGVIGWLLPREQEKEPQLPHRSRLRAAPGQISVWKGPAAVLWECLVGIPTQSTDDRHSQLPESCVGIRQAAGKTSALVTGYTTLPKDLDWGLTEEHRVRQFC